MFSLTSFYNVLLPALLLLSPGPSSATPTVGFPSPADLLTARHGSPHPSHSFPASPFNFKPAFIKLLGSGPNLPTFDLPTGGTYFVSPYINGTGTVSGPLLNGTLLGGYVDGVAGTSSALTKRNAIEYGVTDDGDTFTLASDIINTADGVPISRVVSSLWASFCRSCPPAPMSGGNQFIR